LARIAGGFRSRAFSVVGNAMNVLAISGSLRAASINSAFCRVAALLAPPSLAITVFDGLGGLPLFNPDLDTSPPRAVQDWRAAVGRADALIVASPEYAHGLSGPLKNALDWLVSFEGTVYKPVAVVNTSPRARHAYAALREVAQTMSLVIVDQASVTLPLLGACTTDAAMLASTDVVRAIRGALGALATHLAGPSVPTPNFPLGNW
jgi:NAD(P)H-dependent FMN reductase